MFKLQRAAFLSKIVAWGQDPYGGQAFIGNIDIKI